MNEKITSKNSSLQKFREERWIKAFKLRDEEKLTFKEIGKSLGVGSSRASELVAKGSRLTKYRKLKIQRKLDDG